VALLSRKADYALLILSYLHHRPEGGCAREVWERFGLKKAFTANVLKLLCRRGLVRSQRGAHGGYVLARPADEIVLSDLLELLDEPFQLAECNGPPGCCLEQTCVVRSAIAAVDERIRDVLRGVTLADLCRESPATEGGRYGLALIGEGADT
jgi:Rrf2 family cysteine metabolism transcriptional repressor